jgi:hypothetical protein
MQALAGAHDLADRELSIVVRRLHVVSRLGAPVDGVRDLLLRRADLVAVSRVHRARDAPADGLDLPRHVAFGAQQVVALLLPFGDVDDGFGGAGISEVDVNVSAADP